MKLSSGDGTNLTVEQLQKVRLILGNCFERIVEINNGTYKKGQEKIQFDYVTSSKLSNAVDDINEIMNRITKLVYQE